MPAPIQFDIVPHIGIGPVHLGMTPDAVEAAVGSVPGALPRLAKGRKTHCYFKAALQVSFGESGLVNFIGVSGTPLLECRYEDRDVFDLPAPELFALIASRERSGRHDYSAAEYVFPEQIVTLYEADEQYDRKGGESRPVFAEVGVGNAEYLAVIRALRGTPEAG
ncbi:hypothetical protein NG895_28460 [Aeoliella sp. ICT_H6.2]|uniref:Uncharacterized protein n=1 Tax=Aeoliella straminimaris TaxID=2954799 RepID=A0A9X2FGQ2_9BACT|nr:hypothetical protein [Aeoliella straminimaris]MCO6047857.1 hypothetical protein [Aeoliella straminimaris]